MKKNFYKSLFVSSLFLATVSIIAFAGRNVAPTSHGLTNTKVAVKKMRSLTAKNKSKASTAITSIPADITINFNSSGFQEGVASGSTFTQGDFKFIYSGSSWYQDTDNGQSGGPGLFAADYSGTPESITIQTTTGNEFDLVSFYINLYGGGFSKIEGFKDGVSTGVQTTGSGFGETGGEWVVSLDNGIFNDVDRVVITSNAFGFWDIFDTFVLERSKPPVSNVQASNITFTGISSSSEKIDWTNGSGTSRIVLVSSTTTGSPNVTNGTTYVANADYNSAGTVANSSGGAWRCVYNGTGSTVTVTNFSAGTTYRVMVLEYTGSGSGTTYNATPSTNNPTSFTTLVAAPSSLQVSGASATSFSVAWTNRVGATSYEYDVTTGADNSFAAPLLTGVAVPSNSAVVTGLTAGSVYRFRVRSVNSSGAGSSSTALTISTLTGNLINGSYEFTAATSGSTTLTDPTPVPAPKTSDVTFGSFSYIGPGTATVTTGIFGVAGWPATDTQGSYYEVTLTPQTGVPLNLTEITYAILRNSSGPNKFYVRSSVDSYATNLPLTTAFTTPITVSNNELSVGSTTGTFAGTTITLGSSFSNITTPVTFRFYGYGASNTTTGQFNIDRVQFDGSTGSSNTAPTDIALSANSINENVAANSTVGTLSTTDAQGGTMSYALVTGTGDTDNSSFTLTSGGSLSINASPNFETKSSYSIRVRATDPGNLTFEKEFMISINNVNEAPVALADSYTADNGSTVLNAPNVLNNDTDPDANAMTAVLITGPSNGTLTLNADGSFNYLHNGSNTTSDSFTYRADDGTLSSNIATATITISPLNVTVNSITRVDAQLSNATSVSYTVTFSSAVSGVDASDFTLTTSGTTGSIGSPTGSGTTWTVPITSITGNGTLRLDFIGTTGVTPNVSAAYTVGEVYTFDRIKPVLSAGSFFSNNAGSGQYAKVGDVINLGIGFNESIHTLTMTIGGHTVTPVASNSDRNWMGSYTTVSGDTEGNVPWTYEAKDAAGNVVAENSTVYGTTMIFDKTPPAISFTAPATADAGSDLSFGIAYTDANFGNSTLTATDITVNATGTATYTSLTLAGSGSSYTATLNGVSGLGTLGITVGAGTARDIPGNVALASSPSATVAIASNNASLSALTTTANGLSPAFVSSTDAYTTSVPYATTSIKITPTADQAGATIQVRVNGGAYTALTSGSQSAALAMNVGTNTIDILVTAENGVTTKTYTIAVERGYVAPTDMALSASTINENVPANSTVGTLSTTDADAGDTFTYTLVSGTGSTDNSAFTISGNNLNINASPNFETKSSYSVRIRTTDQGGLTYEEAFVITINDLVEAATVTTIAANTITSTSAKMGGNVVSNGGGTVTERGIAWGLTTNPTIADNKVAIGSGQGVFSTSVTGLPSGTKIHYRAYATNSATTAYGSSLDFITVPAAPATPVASAVTSTGFTLTWTPVTGAALYRLDVSTASNFNSSDIVTGYNGQPYGQNISSAVVTGLNPSTTYYFRLRAVNDNNASSASSTAGSQTTIAPANTAPTDIALSATSINENVAANTTVGTLSTTDVDASNTFTYALVSGTGSTDNSSFNISGNSLVINASPDFETKSSYSIRIRSTDQGGLSFEKQFTITINNTNDAPTLAGGPFIFNPTTIGNNSQEILVSDLLAGLTYGDQDAGALKGIIVVGVSEAGHWQFSNGSASDWINASSRPVSATNGVLLSASDKIFYTPGTTAETASITFRAWDQSAFGPTSVPGDVKLANPTVTGGTSSFSTGTASATIIVDLANTAPTNISLSATSINENVAANATIGTLSTTDADAANTFTYTLVSGTGSTDNAAFNISGSNLRITASPDFENQNSYSVRIRTTDQGGLTYEKVFNITINNVNEAPTDIFLTSTSVAENVTANTTVATLSPGDPDPAGSHSYSLVSGTGDTDNAAFNISGNSLRISASPDFETKSSYSIRLRNTDQDGLIFEKVVTITVTNANEAPSDIALSATSMNENVAGNTTVGTLSTTDPDAANTFTYTLVSGTGSTDNAAFNISGSNLRIAASPNFETKNSYSVRVRTTDQGGLTFEKAFTITINNVNEAPTALNISANSINENVAANSTVGTLSSTDVDADDTFTYTLVSGSGSIDNSLFNISGNSLKLNASPNFETKPGYSVRVRTTDAGGLSFESIVTITVNDLNEAPVGMSLLASSVNENVAANSIIGPIFTTDFDSSQSFTYTLVSGIGDTDNAAFSISANNLKINLSPDFETKSSYSIRLRTTDAGGLTYEKSFTITVNNLNEAPTDVALSASTINENVAANAVVGTLSSTDVDASNTFTYTLVSGTGSTDNAAFNINGNSLRITASPDFEAKNSYSVRVRTTDQGGLTFEKVLTININNVNEIPTDIALSTTAINENTLSGSTVGTLSSTDPDVGENFTYSLVSGAGDADNSAFNIVGNSLRIALSPNFEVKSSYSVRIRTSDHDEEVFEKVFTITINNVNEAPTDIALSATSINENVAANSTVGTLSTTDQDSSNTFTYTLVTGTGDSDNAAFNISGGSLRINASPDYETNNTYSVRVRTTDQGGLSFEKVLTININDVTELIFTTTSLPNATVGVNYEQQINVTVGASPYTFALASGTLPAGLTLSTDGKISGTATAGGTFNINVKATDQNSVTANKAYTLMVNAPTLTLTASLPNASVAASYSQTITTTGGTAPYTYTLTQGTLPPGLSLSTAGVLSGTPTLGGTFNFTVGSTDSSTGSGPYVNTKAYTLIVDPAAQTITFNANGTATYGDADFDPAATSTNSSINITYSSGDNTIATIVNNKVHIVKAGTVTIYADQAANASYTAAVQKQQTLVISPKTLTVSLTGNVRRAYNGNANATLAAAHFVLAGKVGTDDVSIAIPATATYNDKNVGTGKLVSATALTLDGLDRGNYQLSNTTVSANIGLISAKAITVTINSTPLISKVYDRSSSATLVAGNYTLVDVETGDDVSVSGNATYDSPSAGTGKTITVNTFVLAGSDKDNYRLTTTTATTTGDITAKQLTVALNPVPSITKVYDGDAIATLVAGNYTLTGVQAGDFVTISATAAYDDKTVGTGKTVTARSFVLAGADKDNYSLTTTVATTTGAITAKPITLVLNAAPAISKTYDANTNATLVPANYSLVGLVGADEVTVSGTANYNNATVGTGKTITANAFVLAGADKNNYNLTTTSATTTGAITAKPITVALNAVPAITKVYDGNANATLAASNYTLTGVESGDAVTISGTATYSDKNVASGKMITVSAFVLSGADQVNYSLTTTSATTTGTITAKPITLALNATPLITKVYNGNTVAALASNNYSLTGVVSGDAVSITGTANYNNATAGTSKTITANGFALGGVDKDNYNLTTTTATTTGDIAKANLAITAENKTRIQNTPDPAFTATYAGFVNGETSAVLSSQPTFSTTATLSSLPGTYPIVPTGAVAQNYNISYINGTLTVIPGAPTSITLAQATLFENRPAGTLAGTLSSTSDDPNALFTYTLVAGSGDTDNGLFAIAGQQLNTATSLNFEQKSSYSVRVRSTTQYGLTLDRVITVALTDVNEAPSFNAIANQTICATGENRTIAIGGISAGPETGQTTTFAVSSNNPALFAQLTVANNGVVSYRTADGRSGVATITVTIKDNGGTANGGVDTFSQNFTITVNPLPEVVITTEGGKVELAKGETLVLKASGGAGYNWASAQGIIGNRNNAELTIRPEATTTYTVEATSAAGCTSTKSITIVVKEDLIVVKGTNILSPNGDGKNDRFIIRNIDMYPNNTVKIYDRAGRMVFSQVNYTDQFDGTFQGSPLAEDTYYYIVDFGPTKTKIKGFITIVRD